MDAVHAVVVRLAVAPASEDVNVVLTPLQGGRQFRDVNPDAADRDGMQRFPGKQRDAHG